MMMVRETCTCGHDDSSHGRTPCIDFDDRRFLEEELKPESGSWRKEKYAKHSCVKILDHNEGQSTWRNYDDDGVEKLLVRSKMIIAAYLLIVPAACRCTTAASSIHIVTDDTARTTPPSYRSGKGA